MFIFEGALKLPPPVEIILITGNQAGLKENSIPDANASFCFNSQLKSSINRSEFEKKNA